MSDIELGLSFLLAQSAASLVAIFWFTVIFEIPRYLLPFAAAAIALREREPARAAAPVAPRGFTVSVVLIGHNEEDALEASVRSLREQSFRDFDIAIVSDGSSDRMAAVARRLVRAGLAQQVLTSGIRGGKSSGINLAWASVAGDIVINVDCDCSFDRHAIEHMLAPFADPSVGVACGDVAPRNAHAGMIAQFQEIEYLQSISVGKRIGNATDQVVCASGAFSAFRRSALDEVGGFDTGGGEDLDITMRLRNAGWRSVFVPHAVCYTDVPVSAFALIRQRMRWERDSIWIRYRKHAGLMSPARRGFRPAETFHQWDFLLFSVAGAFVFPVYLAWLCMIYGAFTPAILIAMQAGLLLVDAATLAVAAFITGRPALWRNLAVLPAYAVFMTWVMRPVRLIAYIDEWCFCGSHRDNYTPLKVRAERAW